MHTPFSLEGKVILVTGASSGIGRSIAIECSKMGAKVVITGRNEERLNSTFEQLYTEFSSHEQIVADLASTADIPNFVDKIPNLDGVVHCAGLTKTMLFQFLTDEAISSVMDVNFKAPTLISQQLMKKKKLQKGASVVFISSISGVHCSAIASSIYSASKGAVNGLMKGMALDLAPKGIRVNSVNPGMIDTDIFSAGTISEEQLQEDMKRYPMKRYGKPEEVAYAVVYLLSDATKWMTGTSLLIDGGYTLQ